MQSSSPSTQYPSTPAASRHPLQYRPLNSSPLADSPGKSSPVAAAQARRRSQYKALAPVTPVPLRSFSSSSRQCSGRLFSNGKNVSTNAASENPDPQKVFLRDRFKARCFERAAKARERAIRGKRYVGEPSSDDFDMEGDEEEGDEDIMQDELFRRIMANANRKEHHSYRVSYAQDVGSSFDPDFEDINTWEQELTVPSNSTDSHAASTPVASTSGAAASEHSWPEEREFTPVDLDDEELEAYAEECARRAALADFEDIPEDDLFGWSDAEELGTTSSRSVYLTPPDEDCMDVV